MPYVLGIDVGTARTRAAVSRPTGKGWSAPTLVGLGARDPWLPTIVHLTPDHAVLVGAEAERCTAADPTRTARGFAARIGDPVPIQLGDTPCAAEELTAILVRWVTDVVAAQEGGPADRLVLTHPATWGPCRRGLLLHELSRHGLPDTLLVPAAIAIAEGVAERHPGLLASDAVLAVFSLGTGIPGAAVVRGLPAGGFELLAGANGVDPVGGGHFDDAVLACVRAEAGRAMDELDPNDRPTWLAIAKLRAMCVSAKEMLSAEPEVLVPLGLPGLPPEIRVARVDFERAIGPAVTAAVDVLRRVIRATGRQPDEIDAIALAGGSARVPLVARSAIEVVPARVLTIPDPDAAGACGAAATAARLAAGRAAMPAPVAAERTELISRSAIEIFAPGAAPVHPDDLEPDDVPPRPPIEIDQLELPDRRLASRIRFGRRRTAFAAGGLAVVAAGVALTFMLESGSGNRSAPSGPLHVGPAEPAAQQSPLPPASTGIQPTPNVGKNPGNNPGNSLGNIPTG